MARRKFLKSEAEAEQFEIDQEVVDAVNDEVGFGDDVSNDDVKEAIAAIATIAEQVLEEGDKLEPAEVVEKVAEIVEGEDFSPEEEEAELSLPEEEELPEELENALVRVMVQEGDEVEIDGSTVDDEIRQETFDGELATVFDTVGDAGESIEELDFKATSDEEDNGLVVMGNSVARNPSYKRGFVTLKSGVSKKTGKCWSAAYKKVRKMVGSRKLTATDWAIVSCLALSMKKKKAVSSSVKVKNMRRVLSAARNNKVFMKVLSKWVCSKKKVGKPLASSRLDRIRRVGKILNARRRFLKSSEEIDASPDTMRELEPEETFATDYGNVDGSPAIVEGEVVENYGKVPDVVGDGTLADSERDLIEPGAEGVVEIRVALENSRKTLVLKRISNCCYRVSGVRIGSRLTRKCPLKSGTVVRLGNGTGFLLKNSNTAGMLAFRGRLLKSSSSKPYSAIRTPNGVFITQSKRGGIDLFASAEKRCYENALVRASKSTRREGLASRIRSSAYLRRKVASSRASGLSRRGTVGVRARTIGSSRLNAGLRRGRPLASGIRRGTLGTARPLNSGIRRGTLGTARPLNSGIRRGTLGTARSLGRRGMVGSTRLVGRPLAGRPLTNGRRLGRSLERPLNSGIRRGTLGTARTLGRPLNSGRLAERPLDGGIRRGVLGSARTLGAERKPLLSQGKRPLAANDRALKSSIARKDSEIAKLKSQLVKSRIEAIKSRKDTKKLNEEMVSKERERLFQANKEQLSNIAKSEQINSSKNVETLTSMMDRMF